MREGEGGGDSRVVRDPVSSPFLTPLFHANCAIIPDRNVKFRNVNGPSPCEKKWSTVDTETLISGTKSHGRKMRAEHL